MSFLLGEVMKLLKINALAFRSVVGLKKWIACLGIGLTMICTQSVFAQNINTVSLEVLQNIKGVGANKAKKIIDERQRGGHFQNASDLRQRVKGVGAKTLTKMSEAGITFSQAPDASQANENQVSSQTTDSAPEKKLRSKSRQQ